jgi:hypothetical protein
MICWAQLLKFPGVYVFVPIIGYDLHATTVDADDLTAALIAASSAALAASWATTDSLWAASIAAEALLASSAFFEWTSAILLLAASMTFYSSFLTLSLIAWLILAYPSSFSILLATSLWSLTLSAADASLALAIALITDELGAVAFGTTAFGT